MSTNRSFSNKENEPSTARPPTNEEARLRDLKMQRQKLNGTKKPGLFTKKAAVEPRLPPDEANVQEFMTTNLVYTDSLKRWIAELEQMVAALISKNEGLQSENRQLSEQNQLLRDRLQEVQYETELLRSRPVSSLHGSLFGLLCRSAEVPTVTTASQCETEGLPEAIYLKCHFDNNTNFRAYYLSMLQHTCGRNQLRQLLEELLLDGTYHLLPIMHDNEFWVRIAENFLTILDNNELSDVLDFQDYLGSCKLVDLVFISALRSRVEFLTNDDPEDAIDDVQLYTALANHFAISFELQKTVNYDIYCFCADEYEFRVLLTDRNQHILEFVQQPREDSSDPGGSSNRFIEREPEPVENLGTEISDLDITPKAQSEEFSAYKLQSGIQRAHRLNFGDDGSCVRGFEDDYSPNLD